MCLEVPTDITGTSFVEKGYVLLDERLEVVLAKVPRDSLAEDVENSGSHEDCQATDLLNRKEGFVKRDTGAFYLRR